MKPLPFLRFRIYLGHNVPTSPQFTVNVDRAVDMVAEEFGDGFTIFGSTGVYRRQKESGTVFEILLENKTGLESDRVSRLCARLRDEFKQTSVMMTAEALPVVEFI